MFLYFFNFTLLFVWEFSCIYVYALGVFCPELRRRHWKELELQKVRLCQIDASNQASPGLLEKRPVSIDTSLLIKPYISSDNTIQRTGIYLTFCYRVRFYSDIKELHSLLFTSSPFPVSYPSLAPWKSHN